MLCRQGTRMALQAMRPLAASTHNVATLKGCHLNSALATPAASAPPSLTLDGSAASWQTLSQVSTPPCECLASLLQVGHPLHMTEFWFHISI